MNPVKCFGGTRVIPDYTMDTAPVPDIIFVPGTGGHTISEKQQPQTRIH